MRRAHPTSTVQTATEVIGGREKRRVTRKTGRSNGTNKKRTTRGWSWPLKIVLGFGLFWGVGIWFAISSFSVKSPTNDSNDKQFFPLNPKSASHEENQAQPPQEQQLDEKPPTKEIDDTYFGWQPEIPETMECSWRKCFEKEHTCSSCRDRVEDMGEAPPVSEDWVPDVTLLRRMFLAGKDSNGRPWPPPLDTHPELCEPIGVFGGQNDENKLLLDAVPIQAQPFEKTDSSSRPTPKVLCMVYTMEKQHATSIRAMRETWAPGCDGFLAFSTASDPRIPAISLPHLGKEAYENMWQKVRSIWHFVGTHYLEDFDFFFQGGEDLFVLPQNLKNYLSTVGDPEDDHFIGRRFKGYGNNNYFNSGGSGYAISRGTLRKYITEGFRDPKCSPTKTTSMEDVMIAKCLREVFDIGLTDTRDDQLRERFHPFSPGSHYTWRPPPAGAKKDWYEDYNVEWPPLLKEKCCAPDSVSFHYIKKPAMVRHLHALLYECPNRPLVGE